MSNSCNSVVNCGFGLVEKEVWLICSAPSSCIEWLDWIVFSVTRTFIHIEWKGYMRDRRVRNTVFSFPASIIKGSEQNEESPGLIATLAVSSKYLGW